MLAASATCSPNGTPFALLDATPLAARQGRWRVDSGGLRAAPPDRLECAPRKLGVIAAAGAPALCRWSTPGDTQDDGPRQPRPFGARPATRLALLLDLPPDLGTVEADERTVEQALFDLLTNAATFTPAGGRVTVTARRDGDRVAVAVADTGIGVPDEDLPRVFVAFGDGAADAGDDSRRPSRAELDAAAARPRPTLHPPAHRPSTEGRHREPVFVL